MAYNTIKISNTSDSTEVTGISKNNTKNFLSNIASASSLEMDIADVISSNGDFKKISGINVIIKSLTNLFSTSLGTYPFDPTYGTTLHEKIFSLADNITEQEIISEILTRVKYVDPRIVIANINVQFYNNKKGFRVNINLNYNGISTTVPLEYTEEIEVLA